MSLTVTTLPDAIDETWDAGLERWDGTILFSRAAFLKRLGDVDLLAVLDGDRAVALFPVPVTMRDGVRRIERSTYVSPYFPILFPPDVGPRVRTEQRRRAAVTSLIDHIRGAYARIVLPLHPDLMDLVPLQRAHVQLELRATYELPLGSLDELLAGFGPAVRNHLRKAAAVVIEPDPSLLDFDFDAAAFYEDEQGRAAWRALAKDLVAAGQATPLIARLGKVPFGGLFLAHDRGVAYNLLSYFDRTAPIRGIPSALIWAAARMAADLGMGRFDLEGSVLPGVESFYHSFGGLRRPYVQIHWHADEREQRPVLYRYVEASEA